MKKTANSLLVEIMIAVLCFALAATVILKTFVTARSQSDQAEAISQYQYMAENLAERIYASEDPAQLPQLVSGQIQEDGSILVSSDDHMKLLVTLGEEKTEAGTLRRGLITVLRDGETVLELPCSRYQAEVRP